MRSADGRKEGSMPRIGVAGLGLMGRAMAERLLEVAGALTIWNRDPAKGAGLVADGAARAASLAELAQRSDLLLVMVTDGRAVESLLDAGLHAALDATKTFVNASTVGPVSARALAKRVTATGARYVDAPVLGSITPARSGELLVFAGGEDDSIERALPLLEGIGKKVVRVGAVGQASALKLITNMLLARYVEALGEVLALDERFGLDPGLTLDVLQSSALASPMWEKGRTLLEGAVPLHFPLRHMAKDLRLLDEEVERFGLNLPGHQAVHSYFQEALAALGGECDYSEIARSMATRRAPLDQAGL